MKRKNIIYVSLLIAVGCSLSACSNTTKEDTIIHSSTEENEETYVNETATPIDLYGNYDQNDLIVHTIEEAYEGIVLELPQIEGLKDKKVQDAINQDILRQTKEAYNEIKGLRFLSHNVNANFSNVLSMSVYMGGEAEDSSKQIHLNYNLNTGEALTFEELFLADANQLDIVYQAFRNMLITNQMQGDYDENKLYKIVKSYTNADAKTFAFTPTSILLYYKDMAASVKMIDIADKVAVYSRFLSEDTIFERDDIGKKELFTCMDVPENLFEIWKFGYLEDNLWYDFIALEEYFPEEKPEMHMDEYIDFKKEMYEIAYADKEMYREIAKNHQDRFYILLMKPGVRMESESEWLGDSWNETYTGKAFVNKNVQWIEMPRDLYDAVYREKLLDAYRYEYLALAGGIYLDVTEDKVHVEHTTEEAYYDYITEEQLATE